MLCGFRDHDRDNLASWNYGSHWRRALLSVHPASRFQILPAMPIWRIGDPVFVTSWFRSASESDSRQTFSRGLNRFFGCRMWPLKQLGHPEKFQQYLKLPLPVLCSSLPVRIEIVSRLMQANVTFAGSSWFLERMTVCAASNLGSWTKFSIKRLIIKLYSQVRLDCWGTFAIEAWISTRCCLYSAALHPFQERLI